MEGYCIYLDEHFPQEEMSREHVFPLSLGGIDGFEIPANERFNNVLGSEIDGKLANDFMVMLDRMGSDARGHTNKKVQPVWKKSQLIDENKPIQLVISNDGIKLFCPIQKRYLGYSELRSNKIQVIHTVDKYIRLKFAAKTILSAGYFVYGNLFKDAVNTDALRELMNMETGNMDQVLKNSVLKVTDQFCYEGKDKTDVDIFQKMSQMLVGSSVIFLLSTENIIASVSVLGTYIATINVPAQTHKFPNEGDYRLGHVVYIDTDKNLRRLSFHSAVGKLAEKLGIRS